MKYYTTCKIVCEFYEFLTKLGDFALYGSLFLSEITLEKIEKIEEILLIVTVPRDVQKLMIATNCYLNHCEPEQSQERVD